MALGATAAGALAHEHVLLYLLGIPVLVPAILAAYAVAGERQLGTLEPMLTTPIRARGVPAGQGPGRPHPVAGRSHTWSTRIFSLLVGLLAQPGVASALLQGPDLARAAAVHAAPRVWSIWVGIGVSTRSSDVRVAQQVGLLASLPPVFVVVLIALDVIPATLALAVGAVSCCWSSMSRAGASSRVSSTGSV